ncbi:mitochondrial ribosomal subunit S27-domain-containing protein [Nemania sp. NC0429]|nr:mitochondrial ribosomal subunit S27-domain-containing protein [Nemania sp. NC0429]
MAAIPRARLLDLMKVQCQIFSTTYNPERIRMGNKILRQRLKGPSLEKYYPPRGPTILTLEKEFKSLELETINEEADWREEHLEGQPETTRKGCTEEEAHAASGNSADKKDKKGK